MAGPRLYMGSCGRRDKSDDAWRGQVEGSLERHFLYSVLVIGGKGESQDNSRSGQIPTAYGCGVANRHNLIRA